MGTQLAVITSPVKGLDVSKPSLAIDQRSSTKAKNVRYLQGALSQRPGTGLFQATTTDEHMAYFTARFESGARTVLVATLDDLYEEVAGVWNSIGTNIFTGATGDHFTARVILDKFYISNGIDVIRSWDGSAGSTTTLTKAPACRAIEEFADRLIAAHIVLSGTFPYRVQWSINGNPDTWTGTGSGSSDMILTPGWIYNMRRLRADQLIIYKEDSIIVGTRTGVATEPIAFNQKAADIGIAGYRAIDGVRNRHYFLGQDLNVYEFRGVEPVAIGDDIVRELQTVIDSGLIHHSIVRVNPFRSEVYVAGIAINKSQLSRVYCYNWDEKAWSTWEDLSFRAFDVVKRPTGKTWNGTSGDWNSQAGVWGGTGITDTPLLLIGNSNQAYELDDTRTSDLAAVTIGGGSGDVPVDFDWQSKDDDYGLTGKNKTVTRVGAMYKNLGQVTDLQLEVSTDEGNSWTATTLSIGSASDVGKVQTAWADPIVTGANVRVRLRNNIVAQAVEIHQLIVEGEPSGAVF